MDGSERLDSLSMEEQARWFIAAHEESNGIEFLTDAQLQTLASIIKAEQQARGIIPN